VAVFGSQSYSIQQMIHGVLDKSGAK
jgi:hypothetical protein